MKTLKSILLGCLIALSLVGIGWYALPLLESKTEYIKGETEVIEKINTISELDKRIEDDWNAEKAKVEEEAEQTKQNYIENARIERKTKVTDEYILEIETVNNEDKKKTTSY